MDKSTHFGHCWLKVVLLLLPALLVQSCGNQVGVLKGVSPVQPIPVVATTPQDTITPLSVVLSGSGKCTGKIDWGDTHNDSFASMQLGSNPVFTHIYTGWGGGKTVTVEGTVDCVGKVNTRFVMEPSVFELGFNMDQKPTNKVCNNVPTNFPFVEKHDLVHISTSPATSFPKGINFGCPLDSCIYDADGRPGSVADSSFPFPGLREFSLVLRVSSQVVQGGTNISFVSTDAGVLEVCTNDSDQSDNSGGYRIKIRVDELGP